MSNVDNPNFKNVIIFDMGNNISTIKRELHSAGVEDVNVEHILCTTDRGDQDLGYEITFSTNNDKLIANVLKNHHGYFCENIHD